MLTMRNNFKSNNTMCISNKKKQSIKMSIKSSSGSWNHQWWCFIAFTIYCCFSRSVLGQMPSATFATITNTTTTATATTEASPQSAITTNTTTMAPPLTPRVIVESIAVNEQDVKKSFIGKESETIQQPHAFRHQQHYSHRIEQAVKDFRQQQLKQLQASHLKERDKLINSKKIIPNDNNNNNNNKNDEDHDDNNKVQSTKWQTHLNTLEQLEHHQRRHEHHWLLLQQRQREELRDKKKSHLRHSHSHSHSQSHHHAASSSSSSSPFSLWDQQFNVNVPTLRHQRHRNALITTTTLAPYIREPITEADNELDKENNDDKGNRNLRLRAINSLSLLMPTTNLNYSHRRQPPTQGPLILGNRGPSTRGPSKMRHQKQRVHVKDIMYSDEIDEPLSGRRLSLKLHQNEEEEQEMEKLSDNITRDFVNELDADDDDNDENDDDDDDDESEGGNYSYEEDENDDDESSEDNFNQYPTSKPHVKRFTKPLKNDFKSFRSSDAKLNTNTNNDNSNYNKKNNNDENIPDDKIRLRVQQHHMRQQQHQHELEALRARHGSLADATNNRLGNGPNKHNINNNNNNNQDAESLTLNYIPGSVTRQKQDKLGSVEAVHDSRRSHLFNQKKYKDLAAQHVDHIFEGAACKIPKPRIIHIEAETSKRYTPHCTVLHRCADDTGCCLSLSKTCAPKRTQSVDLYFFVHRLHDKRGYIEHLTFVNHTECHCVEKSRVTQHDDGAYNPKRASVVESESTYLPHHQLSLQATILNCNCPNWFEKILQDDGSCRCDCTSGNIGCERFKKGLEHFSIDDRKCIKEGRCKPPTCEYGSYVKRLGACTRREEQLAGVLGMTTNTLYASSYH